MCPNVNRQYLICHCDRLLGHQLAILNTEKGKYSSIFMLFFFLLSIGYVTINTSRKTSQIVDSGSDERVMGSGYNTDEASLTGLQLTFCGGLVPIDQGLVLVLTLCVVLWTPSLSPILGHSVRQTTMPLPSFCTNTWH